MGIAIRIGGLAVGSSSGSYWTPRYYVSNTGNDVSDGLTPETAWQTIAKVNASSFVPGDKIGFQRNGVWREELIVPSSGTESEPITFGAYGVGVNPIINGCDLVSEWSVDDLTWLTGVDPPYSWYTPAGANYNVRNVIGANTLPGGTSIRLSFKATGGIAVIDGVAIGAMTTGSIFDSAPTRVTFGGNNGVTIPSGTTVVSDEILFTVDRTKRHGIHIFAAQRRYLSYSETIGQKYTSTAADLTDTLNYGFDGPSAGWWCFDLLEVFGTIPNIYNSAVIVENPRQVFKDQIALTKGQSKASLNNHEWFSSSNVLSYRDDAINPQDAAYLIEATVRKCITTNNKGQIIIKTDIKPSYYGYERFIDNIIRNPLSGIVAEPTALVSDDGSQIDLWVTSNRYCYSTDGEVFSALQQTDIPAGYCAHHILKEGNTYYLYAVDVTYHSIHLFTGTDKLHFTDQGEVIALGAAGAWDATTLGNTFVWKEGAVWYMLYEAAGGSGFKIGLATSDDGIAWSKYVNNPVISELLTCGNPELPRVNNQVIKSNGMYYCYYHQQNITGLHNLLRAYSSDLHTWVKEGICIDGRIEPTNPNFSNGDQCLVQFKGKSYLFYTNDANNLGAGTMRIDIGVDNRTLAELLALYP